MVRVAHRASGRARRDAAAARGVAAVARCGSTSFLGGAVALLWWGIDAHRSRSSSPRVPRAWSAFAVLVVVHARVLEDVERAETAHPHQHSRTRAAGPRLERAAGSAAAARARPRRASLRAGSRRLRTRVGREMARTAGDDRRARRRCGNGCSAPAAPDEIRDRQAAVEELAPKREWREALAIEGQLTAVSAVRAGALSRMGRVGRRARAARDAGDRCCAARCSIWILFALFFTWRRGRRLVADPAGGRHRRCRSRSRRGCTPAFDRAALGERALRRYVVDAVAGLHARPWTAPELMRLQCGDVRRRRRAGDPGEAGAHRRLVRAAQRRAAAALSDSGPDAVGLSRATSRWSAGARGTGAHVRGWLEALGSVDALATLAMVRADEPGVDARRASMPTPAALRGRGARPSADPRRSPASSNDVEVGPPRHDAADHRIEHVGQEHAAARDRAERRAGAGRRAGLRRGVRDAAGGSADAASASRTRSSSACRISWRRSRG